MSLHLSFYLPIIVLQAGDVFIDLQPMYRIELFIVNGADLEYTKGATIQYPGETGVFVAGK